MHASLLEDQERVLEEVILLSTQIVEQQQRIQTAARLLKDETRGLEVRSGDLQRVLQASQHQLEIQTDLSIPLEMINKLAGEVRNLKDEQRARFEELEQMVEQGRGQVEEQLRAVAERRLESRGSLGEVPEGRMTNGGLEEEEELAEAGSYIRQLSQPGIQLNSMALVNVRVKSRLSAQESSVDDDESRGLDRLDSHNSRDPLGLTKRLQSLESEVTEFMTPPRKRSSQKKRYEQPSEEIHAATASPPKSLPRQECIDLVVARRQLLGGAEGIEVEQEDDTMEDHDRCSESTRELNDDIEEVGSVSPNCFVTEFGQTEVHFEASDPIDDVGDNL